MKVLAAVTNGLSASLAKLGLDIVEVQDAEGVEGLLEVLAGADPSFAVVDLTLPFATDLVVQLKAKVDGPERDRIPVVTVGRGGRTLRCASDADLGEKGLGAQGAEAVLEVAKGVIMRRARRRRLFDQEALFLCPSERDEVDRLGDCVEVMIGTCGYDVTSATKLAYSAREAIGNAAEHGNKYDPLKTIRVLFLRSDDRVAIAISDEGPGFDTSSFLARAEQVSALEHTRSRRETESRPGGLGVFIMVETCDSICFNEVGNSIYLMKYLPGHETVEPVFEEAS